MILVQILGLGSDSVQVYFKEVMCESLACIDKYKLEAQAAGAVRILLDCAI